VEEKGNMKGKEAVRAGMNVIGTRRLSCVASLKGVVVEHEAVVCRTRDKRKSTRSRADGRSDAEVRSVPSLALRGSSKGILTPV
jgi:hypothetical protein